MAETQRSLPSQLNKLQDKYHDFYNVSKPNDYIAVVIGYENNQINILEEISVLNELETAYSPIEAGTKSGNVYATYHKYLGNVRKQIGLLNELKKQVEADFGADIKNCKILIRSFEKVLQKD